jgi:predicted Zn finger-like uncharacterized protein
MLIVCPNCATSYRVAPESLGDSGRSVRCTTCHNLWFAQPSLAAAQDTEAAERGTVDPALIRPPLNDVVDIGKTPAMGGGEAFEGPGPAEFSAEPTHQFSGHDGSPSIVPPADRAFAHGEPDAPRDIERAALARERKLKSKRRFALSRHALPALICALGLALVCLIAARQQIVRFLPQTASLYARIGLPVNLRGLAFENIKTAREVQDGVPMLVVEGEIVGITGRHTEVPRLRFAVTDGSGKEIYAWTARPARTLLPPGETLPFRSRLASPPASAGGEASGVTVRFFNRRDAQAGFM